MLAGVPVLAANEGGPTETVVDGQTGWLRDVQDVDQWKDVMDNILNGSISDATLQRMGYQGRQRVKSMFSKEKMASRLDEEIKALDKVSRPPVLGLTGSLALLCFVAISVGSAMVLRS
jgi:alpha-1,3/alpha-1,6-mannosyltransferase